VTQTNKKLEALRTEIDRLDDELLEVLERRVGIVKDIAAAKREEKVDGPIFRPGREANVMRRILEKHSSDLADEVVARIWREMISAVCRMQKPHSVAITAPEKSVGFWDLARCHFGSATPMTLHKSPMVVLREVSSDSSTLGVMPWLNLERDTWWVHLAQGGETVPKVLACLPFTPNRSGSFEDLTALVIGQAEPEPSGNDETLMVLVTQEEVSRARLNEYLEKTGIPGYCIDSRSPVAEEGDWLHLFQIPEFVPEDDPRLVDFKELVGSGVIKLVILGAFAVPMKSE
jgi:chorismate mutase/prephenate dehydratase